MRLRRATGPSMSLKSGNVARAPVEPQAAHAPVGVDSESRVRGLARVLQLLFEEVSRVRLQARARQKLAPVFVFVGLAGREPALLPRADFERTALGEVTLEVRGVHFDAAYVSARAELYHAPVVAGAASSFSLPAVAHVGGAAGHDEVVTVAEELVARGDDEPAVLDRREVYEPARASD